MSNMTKLRRRLNPDAVARAERKEPPPPKPTAHSTHVGRIKKTNWQGRVYYQCMQCPVMEFEGR